MSLKGAIIISAIIHAGLFAPFYNQHLLREDAEKKNSIVVEYVILKELTAAIAANKEITLDKPGTPQIEAQKEAALKPQPAAEIKTDSKKIARSSRLKERAKLYKKLAQNAAGAGTGKEARLKRTTDYVNYYQLIREKIRSKLKANYQHYNHEGAVSCLSS
ncbi:MAG: hypothetical protein NT033_00100 [Candidatus Omnitrophica bacterium]|nr:hypothetical protein [Candidatus Omnitrophota bacterium]